MKINIEPTPKQAMAWLKLTDSKTKFLLFGGGSGGGKTWMACEWLLHNCLVYPGTKWFIGRKNLKDIMNSTYITFLKVCAWHKIKPEDFFSLNGQYNYIQFKNGSRIDLLDLKLNPSDPMYEGLGSMEYTSGFIEEAGEVDFMAFDVLKSRIGRHMNKEYNIKSRIFLTCNPKKGWLYHLFYLPWRQNKLKLGYHFIQSLYGDNPHTLDEYEENLNAIENESTRLRLRDGIWEYDDDPTRIFNYDDLLDIWTNTADKSEDKYLTGDLARLGQDNIIVGLWKGWLLYKVIKLPKQKIDQTVEDIKKIASDEQIKYSHIVLDESGLGAGAVDHIENAKGFVASNSAILNNMEKKEQKYKNLRSQCFHVLSMRVKAGKMACSVKDPKIKETIIQELEQIKQIDPDLRDGPYTIIPKDDIKKALAGRSPDYADMISFRSYFDLQPSQEVFMLEDPDNITGLF